MCKEVINAQSMALMNMGQLIEAPQQCITIKDLWNDKEKNVERLKRRRNDGFF